MICCAVFFAVGGIVVAIIASMQSDHEGAIILGGFSALLFIGALAMGITAFSIRRQRIRQDQNFSDTSSVAYKVMGENSKFVYFNVIPNAKSQTMGNVAASVAGIASAAIFGVGMIKWGKDSLDAYVSDDELVINTANSANFDDSNFSCYKSDEIENITFESLSRYERITIYLTGNRGMCFDVSTSQYPAEYIREKFGNLLKKPVQEEVFAEMQ